jgi:hypothetical protein
LKFVTSVLVDPWRDFERAKILLAGGLGVFGVCLLCLVLSYTLAGQGLTDNLIYQILRILALGLLGIGASFWLVSKPKGRLWVLLCQIFGVGLFILGPTSPVCCAIGYALATSGFWATYNERFALQQSVNNNGREMALGMLWALVTNAGGTWLGGYLLQKNLYGFSLTLGLAMVVIATQLLYSPFPCGNILKEASSLIPKRKPSSWMSFYAGILSAVQDSCLPSWFRVMGLSPLSTGTILAMQSVLGFVFAPIVGNLVQKGTFRSSRVGGVVVFAGWVLMFAVISNPWLLAVTLGFLSVGRNFIDTTEATRWFKLKTPQAITARENLLAYGRFVGFSAALPMAFLAAPLYPALAIGVSFLFMFGIPVRSRGLIGRSSTSAPVKTI